MVRLEYILIFHKKSFRSGAPGGSVGLTADFGSGHDLTALEFEPRVVLRADRLELGACLDSVFAYLSALLLHTLCLSPE